MKTVKIELSAIELQGIAVAIGNSHWKPADFDAIKGLIAKIGIAAKEFEVKAEEVK